MQECVKIETRIITIKCFFTYSLFDHGVVVTKKKYGFFVKILDRSKKKFKVLKSIFKIFLLPRSMCLGWVQ